MALLDLLHEHLLLERMEGADGVTRATDDANTKAAIMNAYAASHSHTAPISDLALLGPLLSHMLSMLESVFLTLPSNLRARSPNNIAPYLVIEYMGAMIVS